MVVASSAPVSRRVAPRGLAPTGPGRSAPVRMCIGCRGRDDKGELVRLVWTPAGLVIDLAQHQPGRGAYLHRRPACLAQAVKRRALGRALRVDGLAGDELERATAAVSRPQE